MKYETIDDYLAAVADDAQRAALQKLRATIRKAAPQAEEGFSYGVPAFRLGKRPVVAFAAMKAHCGFYPLSPAVIDAHRSELEGFSISKGTVRFQPESPLPAALVSKLVKARLAELEA